MVDEELFFAWLDGELSPEEARRVEAEVAADPELVRLAEEHRAMATGLRGAFESILVQPVPERLHQAMRSDDGPVVSLAEVRAAREIRRQPPLWKQVAALAATLAVGIFAGNLLTGSILPGGSADPVGAVNGRLVASADLESALDTQLASAPVERGTRIGLTFRDKSGAICRTFEHPTANGLACRERGDWRIRSLYQGEGQATDYRMASGPDPRLMEAVDGVIDGEPFDSAAEEAARERGWR